MTGNTTELGYTVFTQTDMRGLYDLQTAADVSCFNVTPATNTNMTDVDNCHMSHKQFCCVDYTQLASTVVGRLPTLQLCLGNFKPDHTVPHAFNIVASIDCCAGSCITVD